MCFFFQQLKLLGCKFVLRWRLKSQIKMEETLRSANELYKILGAGESPSAGKAATASSSQPTIYQAQD